MGVDFTLRPARADTGNGMEFDPHGSVAAVMPVRPWMPQGNVSLAVRSPVRLSEEKLLSPP